MIKTADYFNEIMDLEQLKRYRKIIRGSVINFKYCPYCNGGNNKDVGSFAINYKTGMFKCLRASCDKRGFFKKLALDFRPIGSYISYSEHFDNFSLKFKKQISEYLIDKNLTLEQMQYVMGIGLRGIYECESPIEDLMLYAMRIVNIIEYDGVFPFISQKEINIEDKNYRVDFLFDTNSREVIKPIFKNDCKLIVECDGHEFHSSKEQIKHDNERELALKNAGYDVLRFSGTQIYENPINCAKKIFEYVKGKTEWQIEECLPRK